MPEISVIMATYNNEKYITEAIESILKQTFEDWELIVVDDASTDRTQDKILAFQDDRIIYVRNEENKGASFSANRGIKMAGGRYIARMDGDDISMPERLEKQYEYMEAHSDIGICGSDMRIFGRERGRVSCPQTYEQIKARLIFCSPLPHSSWFARKEVLLQCGLYNERYRISLDYEFLYRLSKHCKMAGINEPYIAYRTYKQSLTGNIKGIDDNMLRIQTRILRELHIAMTESYKKVLNYGKYKCNIIDCCKFYLLGKRICLLNKKYKCFGQEEIVNEITFRFWDMLKRIYSNDWVKQHWEAAKVMVENKVVINKDTGGV